MALQVSNVLKLTIFHSLHASLRCQLQLKFAEIEVIELDYLLIATIN